MCFLLSFSVFWSIFVQVKVLQSEKVHTWNTAPALNAHITPVYRSSHHVCAVFSCRWLQDAGITPSCDRLYKVTTHWGFIKLHLSPVSTCCSGSLQSYRRRRSSCLVFRCVRTYFLCLCRSPRSTRSSLHIWVTNMRSSVWQTARSDLLCLYRYDTMSSSWVQLLSSHLPARLGSVWPGLVTTALSLRPDLPVLS